MLNKDLVILVDSKLATTAWHKVETANTILDCISSSIARRSREVINYLLFGTYYNTSRTTTTRNM